MKIRLFLFGIVTVFFILMVIVARNNIKQFGYKTNQNYAYDLPTTVVTEIKNGVLFLPENLNAHDTVIAKVSVEPKWSSYYFLPFISIKSNDKILKTYMEYRAEGVRYINLSDAFTHNDKKLDLIAHHLNIPNQKVSLSIYPKESVENKKILVIAPHADDAELAAYGLYEKNAQNVFVLTVTASEGGNFHYPNLYNSENPEELAAQYQQKGRMRVWNSLAVPLLAGVSSEQILQLGFFDSTLASMYQNPSQEIGSSKLKTSDIGFFRHYNRSVFSKGLKGGSNWHDLVGNLAYTIHSFQPDIIVTPSPHLDTHKDHEFSTIAVLDALKQLNYQKGELFFYTLHYPGDAYPLGQVGSTLSLPPYFEQPFYFKSIYSFPLDKEAQNRKLLALDAMNDIRPNADNYLSWKAMFWRAANELRHQLLDFDKDLINRFTRSNELFYVVPVSEIYDEKIYHQITKPPKSDH